MRLLLAAFRPHLSIETKRFLLTARIETFVHTNLREERLAWVVTTVKIVATLEPFIAIDTFQDKTPSNHSPEQCPIVYYIFTHDIPNELFKVECTVWHVLLNNASMKVNEDFSLCAHQPILRLQ